MSRSRLDSLLRKVCTWLRLFKTWWKARTFINASLVHLFLSEISYFPELGVAKVSSRKNSPFEIRPSSTVYTGPSNTDAARRRHLSFLVLHGFLFLLLALVLLR